MPIKEETVKILYKDFLEFKQVYWHEEKQEWANITFIQWISDLVYVDEVNKLSLQEEYQ